LFDLLYGHSFALGNGERMVGLIYKKQRPLSNRTEPDHYFQV